MIENIKHNLKKTWNTVKFWNQTAEKKVDSELMGLRNRKNTTWKILLLLVVAVAVGYCVGIWMV